jgi:hypothetical protein
MTSNIKNKHGISVGKNVSISETDYGYILNTKIRNSIFKKVDVSYPIFINNFSKKNETIEK